MKNVIWATFIFIWAFIYSLYEIEVEAKYGWAGKLPVYKIVEKNDIFPAGLSSWNVLMILLLFFSLLNPLFFSYIFNLNIHKRHIYLIIISFMCWTVIEDFMWFNYNPYYNKDTKSKKYKFKKFAQFNGKDIKWHKFQKKSKIPDLYYFIIGLVMIKFIIFTFRKADIDPSGDLNFPLQFLTYIILICIFSYLGKFYCNFYMNNLNKRTNLKLLK